MREGSRQAAALASRFRAENEALLTLAADLTEREWAMDCPDEGRPVGVVIQHIAEGHLIVGAIVRAIAAGRPLPVQAWRTLEQGAAFNARQARRLAAGTQDGGLRLLGSNTERIGRFIDRLSDEDLRRTALGVDGLTLARQIEGGLLGHLRGHAEAVRTAVMDARAVRSAANHADRSP